MDEHTIEVAGTPVFYRSAPVPGSVPIPVYLHGAPTSSDDWAELLARTGGIAPDLIGFGRSGKGGHLEYTVGGLATIVEQLLGRLGLDRVTAVGHDWGAAVALALAARRPQLVARLGVCNPQLEPGRFHLARLLRRPGVGELIMGSTPRWLLARTLQRGGFPDDRISAVWDRFDHGTQRATLRLYRQRAGRAEGAETLAAEGAETLVVWGEADPWLPAEFAERVPNAEVIRIADAGHWPWLQSTEAADRLAEFALR